MSKCQPVPEIYGIAFFCPGCQCLHGVWIDKATPDGHRWTWNGDAESPTIHPSIDVKTEFNSAGRPTKRCHSFVTDGKIRFLNDSTHILSGQIVDLPDLSSV